MRERSLAGLRPGRFASGKRPEVCCSSASILCSTQFSPPRRGSNYLGVRSLTTLTALRRPFLPLVDRHCGRRGYEKINQPLEASSQLDNQARDEVYCPLPRGDTEMTQRKSMNCSLCALCASAVSVFSSCANLVCFDLAQRVDSIHRGRSKVVPFQIR